MSPDTAALFADMTADLATWARADDTDLHTYRPDGPGAVGFDEDF